VSCGLFNSVLLCSAVFCGVLWCFVVFCLKTAEQRKTPQNTAEHRRTLLKRPQLDFYLMNELKMDNGGNSLLALVHQ